MLYWVLFVTLNINGIYYKSFQGAFHSKEECIEKAQILSKDPYFESWECVGKND